MITVLTDSSGKNYCFSTNAFRAMALKAEIDDEKKDLASICQIDDYETASIWVHHTGQPPWTRSYILVRSEEHAQSVAAEMLQDYASRQRVSQLLGGPEALQKWLEGESVEIGSHQLRNLKDFRQAAQKNPELVIAADKVKRKIHLPPVVTDLIGFTPHSAYLGRRS